MEWRPKLNRGSRLIIGDRGYYARIGGKQRWICGKRFTPDEAERAYHRKAGTHEAGVEPLPEPEPVDDAVTLHDILNRWNIDRRSDAARGELEPGSWQQYRLSAKRIDAIAGHYNIDDILPDHIKGIYNRLAEKYGLDFAKRAIGHLRACCNHAEEFGWCKPVRFGGRVVRKLTKRAKPKMKWKLLKPDQIQAIRDAFERRIAAADGRSLPTLIQLRAMFFLALNGGYGAMELAELPRAAVDLDAAKIDHGRGKTGKDHIVPLWPETVVALREAMKLRPDDVLVFRTREGNPWRESKPVYVGGKLRRTINTDNVNERWKEIVEPLGLRVKGQGFYKLKHIHCGIADEAGDPHATFALAGHGLPGAKGHYVLVGEDRVRAVVNFIHDRLFNPQASSQQVSDAAAPSASSSPLPGGKRPHRPRKPAAASTE